MKLRLLLPAALLTLAAVASGHAATRTWTGGAVLNDNWSNNDNWSGNVQPAAGDVLVFPAGIPDSDRSTFNTILGSPIFNRLEFYDTYHTSGLRVNLSGGIRLGASTVVHFEGASLRLWANQTFSLPFFSRLLVWDGQEIDLNGRNLALTSTGFDPDNIDRSEVDVLGRIVGSGGVTCDGVDLILHQANSYTGSTIIGPESRVSLLSSGVSGGNFATLGDTSRGTEVFGILLLEPEQTETVLEGLTLHAGSKLQLRAGSTHGTPRSVRVWPADRKSTRLNSSHRT
mgnify:CR=1 FL=1